MPNFQGKGAPANFSPQKNSRAIAGLLTVPVAYCSYIAVGAAKLKGGKSAGKRSGFL